MSDCDILVGVLQLVVSRVGCYIGGIRAGIGSLRISKLSVILYEHRNKMLGRTRESAKSRQVKDMLRIL